jgi:hypothetical protein
VGTTLSEDALPQSLVVGTKEADYDGDGDGWIGRKQNEEDKWLVVLVVARRTLLFFGVLFSATPPRSKTMIGRRFWYPTFQIRTIEGRSF